MPTLKDLDITSEGTVFQEVRVKPGEENEALKKAMAAGYVLEGKHRSRNVYLMRHGDEYIMLHVTDNINVIPAMGIAVQNVASQLEKLWKRQEVVDVFDFGGVVGELGLHLPAYRDRRRGQFTYLIEQVIVESFLAVNFGEVTGEDSSFQG